MGWRVVKQPNDLLARFSDVVDNFTHVNLSKEDAILLCLSEYGLSIAAATEKVQGGIEDWKPHSAKEKGSGHDRWDECISSIQCIHGDAEVSRVLALASA